MINSIKWFSFRCFVAVFALSLVQVPVPLHSYGTYSVFESEAHAADLYPKRKKTVPKLLCALALVAVASVSLVYYTDPHYPPLAEWDAKTASTNPEKFLPRTFSMTEKVISWTDTLIPNDGVNSYGWIAERFIALTKRFDYYAPDGSIVASARQKFFTWGVKIEITDGAGKLIGRIEERVFRSLLKIDTLYNIYNGSGQLVAESEKFDFFTTHFTLREPGTRRTVAELRRGWWNPIRDTWEVTLSKDNGIDPRVVAMIAAYKTSVDNDRKSESSSSDDP